MAAFYEAISPSGQQRPPVWFLRQVGRYMPQYRELKKNRSLKEFFLDTESIVEATLLGPSLLGVDAAIIFVDILSILEGFSVNYQFAPGPEISYSPHQPLIFTQEPLNTFSFLLEAIQKLTKQLTVPLIAFAASPFTLASYLIEGGASKDFSKTIAFLYQYPDKFQTLLDDIIQATATYLHIQIQAGAAAIQLFESSSLRLPPSLFSKYVVAPNTKLIRKIKQNGNPPVSLFCRCFYQEFLSLYATGADTLHPDYHIELSELYRQVDNPGSIQGNFDPALLLLPQDLLISYLETYLSPLKQQSHYIFNSGHGILPQTPLENVQAVVSCLTSTSIS
ncbi:uroporphyrinogen decarboxylase [Chlamydia sp.]|uniref:uroporphyrinogen decarboxylase n=1 Tax=Chlamydia sp. TaxID=35827 RepID=UPI0025BF0605|nr:uroporphyrinogen decarboxylase [Chlamydia sp.]MBQ8499013.1 uroporphyrinogen decarboxylase [Chlamydia sp.]